MAKKYNIKYNDWYMGMTKPNNTMIGYKIPYADIEKKKIGVIIPNQFINICMIQPLILSKTILI